MGEPTQKKASILVRGFVFLIVFVAVMKLHMWAILLLILSAVGILVADKIGKLPLKNPLVPRTLKYLLLAGLLALPSAHSERERAIAKATSDHAARNALDAAKKMLAEKKFAEAQERLAAASVPGTPTEAEAQDLSKCARALVSDENLKRAVLTLSRVEARKLETGETVIVCKDGVLNQELNERFRSYYSQHKKDVSGTIESRERVFAEQKRKEEKDAKKLQRRLANFGKPPEPSPWDGSYKEVKRYLERTAHDPESIKIDKCTTTNVDDSSGWIVACEYRGKNAFGAFVRNANWFVIRQGSVVKMLPANAYKY